MSKNKAKDSEGKAALDGQAPSAPDAQEVENVQSSSVDLGALAGELEEAKNKYLYLQADYQNFRRRTAKDISDARLLGTANAVDPFLRVNDFLEMARLAAEKTDNIDSLKQGLMMIIGEYTKAMDELGVKKLKTVGEKFNPEFHDAVKEKASDTVKAGDIVSEISGGYMLGERLLRPARVIVSRGQETEAAPETQEQQ